MLGHPQVTSSRLVETLEKIVQYIAEAGDYVGPVQF